MAYTIISQNNNTTTLSDGTNTITVPSRVVLATGTTYEITEVNNSTATLEGSDGSVIRDVPCVVVLAGEGGGGGTVDKSKIVNADTIPAASASNSGYVYLYTGATNANYTHGYVYQNVKTATYTGTVSFEAATLSGTTVACSGDNFAAFLTEAGADPTPIVSGTMTYEADATGWRLVGKDSNGDTVTTFLEYVEDYQDAGFTFTGTPQDGDVIAFTCSVTEASASYAWNRIDVQPQAGGLPSQTGHSGEFLTTDGTDASWAAISGGLPSQTGNSGKFLTTDGTDASWATISALQNTATSTNSLTILGNAATVGQDNLNIGQSSTAEGPRATAVGVSARSWYPDATALGYIARADKERSVAIGAGANVSVNGTGTYGVAIGYSATVTAGDAIQIGGNGRTNSETGTLCIGSGNNNYKLLDSDGTIPADRLVHAINKYSTMPTAASTNVGWIVQYTGTTDANYTHGYIYECVSDGGNPATYSWSAVSVQAGGGSSLPSQTGNSGKFLTTDGTDVSWGDALVNNAVAMPSLAIFGSATGSGRWSISLGTNSSVTQPNCTAVGIETSCSGGGNGLALGAYAKITATHAKQLGAGTNSEAGTFCVGSYYNNAAVNYKMMDADGTIPEARLADTTNAQQGDVLTLDSNGNAVWQAGGGGATATTATLATANWSSNSQTVSVTGVTASNVVYVMAAPASAAEYAAAGVQCTAQASGTLTFTCTTTPSSALTVNIAIF